jgi:hypothetical protein
MKYTEFSHLDKQTLKMLKKIRKGLVNSRYEVKLLPINTVIELMERVIKESYSDEMYEYVEVEPESIPIGDGTFSLNTNILRDELDGYFIINKSIIRRKNIDLTDRYSAAVIISSYKEQKARALVYKMIGHYSANWWY